MKVEALESLAKSHARWQVAHAVAGIIFVLMMAGASFLFPKHQTFALLVTAGLGAWQLFLLLQSLRFLAKPGSHSFFQDLRRLGLAPDQLCAEMAAHGRQMGAKITLTPTYLVDTSGMVICKLTDVVWAYQKSTTAVFIGVIPLLKQELALHLSDGRTLEVRTNASTVTQVLGHLSLSCPGIVVGYDGQRMALWQKSPAEFAKHAAESSGLAPPAWAVSELEPKPADSAKPSQVNWSGCFKGCGLLLAALVVTGLYQHFQPFTPPLTAEEVRAFIQKLDAAASVNNGYNVRIAREALSPDYSLSLKGAAGIGETKLTADEVKERIDQFQQRHRSRSGLTITFENGEPVATSQVVDEEPVLQEGSTNFREVLRREIEDRTVFTNQRWGSVGMGFFHHIKMKSSEWKVKETRIPREASTWKE